MTKVLEAPDAWRQSHVGRWDSCALSLKLDLISEQTQPSDMAAVGVLCHRLVLEHALPWMMAQEETLIPIEVMMELAQKNLAQRDVPDEDAVHITARGIVSYRILATKWCYEHQYQVDRIVCREKRFASELDIYGPGDSMYKRIVTGRPDLVLGGPGANELTVLDFKFGWARPSRPKSVEEEAQRKDKLSDKGFVQQLVYSLLLFDEYPIVDKIWLREFYVRWGEVREAAYERWQMERIRDSIAGIVANMDAAVAAGPGSKRWAPTGGTHCGICPNPRVCPIKDELGIASTYIEAQELIGQWHVAGEKRKRMNPLVHAAIERWGEIELPHSKGERVVGYPEGKKSLSVYEPEWDRAAEPLDRMLIDVARDKGVLVEDD